MRIRNGLALVILLVVFTPSPWLASRAFADSKPKAIKFGKLVDGTGNVQSNWSCSSRTARS